MEVAAKSQAVMLNFGRLRSNARALEDFFLKQHRPELFRVCGLSNGIARPTVKAVDLESKV